MSDRFRRSESSERGVAARLRRWGSVAVATSALLFGCMRHKTQVFPPPIEKIEPEQDALQPPLASAGSEAADPPAVGAQSASAPDPAPAAVPREDDENAVLQRYVHELEQQVAELHAALAHQQGTQAEVETLRARLRHVEDLLATVQRQRVVVTLPATETQRATSPPPTKTAPLILRPSNPAPSVRSHASHNSHASHRSHSSHRSHRSHSSGM